MHLGGGRLVTNLFDAFLLAQTARFSLKCFRGGLQIERMVSTGQSMPADQPHRQAHDEWVLLLAGSAGLRIEGEEKRDLRPGDHVLYLLTGLIG